MLPAFPTGSTCTSGASPRKSTISKDAVFEVAQDLNHLRAVHDRLCELARGDLALRDEHERLDPRPGGVGRHRRRGVAGGRAHDRLGALPHCHRERHGHAAVLEGAGGVVALDLEPDVGLGQLREPAAVDERRATLAQGDRRRPGRHVEPEGVLLHDPTPLMGGRRAHSAPPSTLMIDDTSWTNSLVRSASTVAASAASVAVCETTTSWASRPRPSCRTVWSETSCSANTCATAASTPVLSSTSMATW